MLSEEKGSFFSTGMNSKKLRGSDIHDIKCGSGGEGDIGDPEVEDANITGWFRVKIKEANNIFSFFFMVL